MKNGVKLLTYFNKIIGSKRFGWQSLGINVFIYWKILLCLHVSVIYSNESLLWNFESFLTNSLKWYIGDSQQLCMLVLFFGDLSVLLSHFPSACFSVCLCLYFSAVSAFACLLGICVLWIWKAVNGHCPSIRAKGTTGGNEQKSSVLCWSADWKWHEFVLIAAVLEIEHLDFKLVELSRWDKRGLFTI